MDPQRFVILHAKQGWALNNGADTLSYHGTHQAAHDAALTQVAAARAVGRDAEIVDLGGGDRDVDNGSNGDEDATEMGDSGV